MCTCAPAQIMIQNVWECVDASDDAVVLSYCLPLFLRRTPFKAVNSLAPPRHREPQMQTADKNLTTFSSLRPAQEPPPTMATPRRHNLLAALVTPGRRSADALCYALRPAHGSCLPSPGAAAGWAGSPPCSHSPRSADPSTALTTHSFARPAAAPAVPLRPTPSRTAAAGPPTWPPTGGRRACPRSAGAQAFSVSDGRGWPSHVAAHWRS